MKKGRFKLIVDSKWFWISIGVIAATGSGVGIYLLLTQDEEEDQKLIEYSYLSAKFDKYFNVKVAYNNDQKAFLTQDELDAFIVRLKDELPYGPEVIALNDIVIDDRNFISKDNNGVFLGAVNKIFINTEGIRDQLFGSKNIPLTNEAYTEAKFELLMETIFHEYNHFIAHSYLTSNPAPRNGESTSSSKVVEIKVNNDLNKEYWNADFYNVWKENLYNDNVDKSQFSDNTLLQANYDAKTIFEEINIKGRHNLISSINHDVFYPFKSFVQKPDAITDNDLNYYYSMEELFARKMEQISFKPHYPIPSNNKNGRVLIDGHGWIRNEDHSYATGFLRDRIMYENIKWTSNNKGIQFYMKDAPFVPRVNHDNDQSSSKETIPATEIYNELMKIEGKTDNIKISFIQFENNSKVISTSEYHPSINIGKVKIGGFCDDDKKNKYLGYWDNTKNKFIKLADVRVNKFNYKLKDAIMGNYKNLNKNFWTANTSIDVNKLTNKELYLFNDKADKNKAEKITMKQTKPRVISTYLNQVSYSSYQVYIDADGLIKTTNPKVAF